MQLLRSMTEREKKEETPHEEKKKRRFSFSSQFRRASRSRSRPSSVALPNDTPSVLSSTPKTSPPCELHHYLMGERRPHSFHAPDSWVGTPPASLNEYFNTAPTQRSASQSRLGILPSPAKSAFSNQDRDTEAHVPPVPPIPNEVAIKHYRRRSSQDSASHWMLQSVVRHSTPPIASNRHSMPAVITRDRKNQDHPVFADDYNIPSAQERADDYKTLLRTPEGSFQPDLPTAESGDFRCDGFQFGFSNRESKTVRNDEVDDDDQPPQLNHDPLPASSHLAQQPPPFDTNKHMDVSDEDSDRERIRGRSLAPLAALSAKQESDSISPVLPPVGKPSAATSNKNEELEDTKRDEQPRAGRVIRYEDTPFVLARQLPDHVAGIERSSTDDSSLDSRGKPWESVKHSSFDTGHKTSTCGSSATPLHHRVNELAGADGPIGERASDVESPTLGLHDDAFRAGKVRKVSSFEAETAAAGDATPLSDASSDVKDGQTTLKAEKVDTERAFSPVWFAKSDLRLPTTRPRDLGADKSAHVHATTFAEERNENARSPADPSPKVVGEIEAPAQDEIRRHGDTSLSRHTLAGASAAAADSDTSTRSAPPSPVVDAIEGHTASDPVDPSWDHVYNIIDPRVAQGYSDEMRDGSNLVAPVPRITSNSPETSKAEESRNETSQPAMSNGYSHHQANFPDFKHQAQQLQVSNNAMTAPERSRSMLSQISAMVSDEGSNPYPQTSTGRSTPSTIRRMQPDSIMKPSTAPPQIPEEVLTSYGGDDDFDLYADHNGVVKDVQDESGQPLRVGDPQVPGTAPQQEQSRPSTSGIGTAPASRDGEQPRYSFERPMSFISGPEDQDGKPQDQINQAASANAMQVAPIPEQHRSQFQQSPQMGTVYSMNPPANMASPSDRNALRHQPMPASGSASAPSKNIFQAVKSIDPGNKTTQATISSWRPSGDPASHQGHLKSLDVDRQPPQATQISHRIPLEQQGGRTISGQSMPQSTLNHSQGQTASQESQIRDQTQGPRNQFEHQQQLLQRQGQYPRLQEAELKPSIDSSYQPTEQAPKHQEKPTTSKPRLSSMFKNFGGKGQAISPQPPIAAMSSHSKPLPPNPNSGAPFQSVVERFTRPREASIERPIAQPSSFVPPSRPSMGQHPQFSQDSSRMQPTDPRLDSRKPMTSAPPNGYAVQQPPPIPNIQSQVHQASHWTTPEPGKKKRFSSLGALFNRGAASGDGPATKYKLSKEEKKAQKTQQSAVVLPTALPAPQRVPQQQPNKTQQSGLAYYPPGQLPPHTVQNGPPMGLKSGPSQPAPNMYTQRPSQSYQQTQQMPSFREPILNPHSEEASAFLRTKQLALEHQARQSSLQLLRSQAPSLGIRAQPSNTSFEVNPPHLRHPDSGPPSGGYYNPHAEQGPAERGAYATSLAARQQEAPQQRTYAAPQVEQHQPQHERQQSGYGQHAHRDPRYVQQLERQTYPESSPEHLTHQAWLAQREQLLRQKQSAPGRDGSWSVTDARVQQPHQQQDQSLEGRQPGNVQSQLPYHTAHDSRPFHPPQDAVPISPPAVSPMQEPAYEAPPIPAAYSHVSGAFVSPLDQQRQSLFPNQMNASMQVSLDQHDGPLSEPTMQAVSPQVSAQSQAPPNGRSHSDASTMSLVSPISNSPAIPNSSPAPGGQRHSKPRMSSISEVHQQDRPWHLNFPEGTTEQDIVRARQGQYMQERFTAQQQQQAERAAGSPSPRASPEQTTPTTTSHQTQAHGGGFREILPRNSAQSYAASPAAQTSQDLQPIVRRDRFETPVQPTPVHPGQSPPPAAYPLPMSPDPTVTNSPPLSMVSGFAPLPPPKIPHSPMRPGFPSTQPFSFEEQRTHSNSPSSPNYDYTSPQRNVSQYDEQVLDEAPPSYDGPGVPNNGMDKSRPEGPRPPNITTDLGDESRGLQPGSRPRQPSIGILQHPQPASMAASPQRTSPDMGAESLRRQLLQQENLAHMEHVQREKEKRERHERDRQEREAARARARELERSASGGGQVGSLRSIGGSTTGGAPGWERRGSHSNSRPVFELPAVEDDEPTMKATSYPGQEWVPPMWDGD
jgi:hypothetical protein